MTICSYTTAFLIHLHTFRNLVSSSTFASSCLFSIACHASLAHHHHSSNALSPYPYIPHPTSSYLDSTRFPDSPHLGCARHSNCSASTPSILLLTRLIPIPYICSIKYGSLLSLVVSYFLSFVSLSLKPNTQDSIGLEASPWRCGERRATCFDRSAEIPGLLRLRSLSSTRYLALSVLVGSRPSQLLSFKGFRGAFHAI